MAIRKRFHTQCRLCLLMFDINVLEVRQRVNNFETYRTVFRTIAYDIFEQTC